MASNQGPLDITYSAHELGQGNPHPTPAERQQQAARAMLAALKESLDQIGVCSVGKGCYERRERTVAAVHAAIALAEAAGIKAEG